MKTNICYILFLLCMFISSCDKPYVDCEYPDYSNCITVEPENGKLNLKITINDENKKVPMSIYYGNFEHNVICITDTLEVPQTTYTLPADVYYSVKAEYKSGNKTIYAIDGGFLEKKSYHVCDSICWVVKDIDLNLKLKY